MGADETRDSLQTRKTDQSTSGLFSVISLLSSRQRSILQTGLGDMFSVSGSLGLGRWYHHLQGE